jgi:hypothetical protein
MRNCGLPFSFFLLVLAIGIALACGGGPATTNTTGILKSISISPPTADARDYPNGQVQFIATGYYTTPPFQVTPLTATWGACCQENPSSGVSVSTNGLAQCASGSVGTFTVWAFAPSNAEVCPAFLGPCGTGGCQVTGTAQLTCP